MVHDVVLHYMLQSNAIRPSCFSTYAGWTQAQRYRLLGLDSNPLPLTNHYGLAQYQRPTHQVGVSIGLYVIGEHDHREAGRKESRVK